jgi:hypothetical protein
MTNLTVGDEETNLCKDIAISIEPKNHSQSKVSAHQKRKDNSLKHQTQKSSKENKQNYKKDTEMESADSVQSVTEVGMKSNPPLWMASAEKKKRFLHGKRRSNQHIRFDTEETGEIEESMPEDSTIAMNELAEVQPPTTVDVPSLPDPLQCPAYTSLPTPGDTIAFRILEMDMTTFTPKISHFKVADIISSNQITEHVVLRYRTSPKPSSNDGEEGSWEDTVPGSTKQRRRLPRHILQMAVAMEDTEVGVEEEVSWPQLQDVRLVRIPTE